MPNNTLNNGFRLLETMARNPKPWSVAELAVTLDLPKSHVHRLLTSLVELGYLERPAQSRAYQVDVKLFELASALAAEHPLRRLSGTALRRLADQSRGSAYLIVWHDGAPLVLAVDHFGGRRPGTVLEVGKRLDRHSTASGKLFLAMLGLDPTAPELTSRTEYTIVDREQFTQELATIRATQVSISRGEAGSGIFAFAVPVYDREEKIVAAVGLVVETPRVKTTGEAIWVGHCAEAARNLSAALGFTGLYPVDVDAPVLPVRTTTNSAPAVAVSRPMQPKP
ncbi:MAG TPA: IclR family transcriptional regulator [Planctomycetota bacterium]|nr:IclR family transcriptional regulator [Planctomycetota bacterium]